ncbi:MAG: SMP-30/gluconolactonase/LRE family protein, partial [Rhizobiaceae bacterium]|nr:SMP-30/gluconolactonase/LRE family protein [Rhizobiaceae bacterium]
MSQVTVFSEVECELGEGPTYDPASDRLFWFDIRGHRLLEQASHSHETTVHELPLAASALAVIDAERQLLATEKGLYVREVSTGRLSLLAAIEEEKAHTRSNDSRVHPSGAFWMGTMGKSSEPRAGAIYWHFRGETRLLYPDVSIPNSICFSWDGSVAYFADSARGDIMRVACDLVSGLPAGEPQVFRHRSLAPGEPDGSIVDEDGVLWNARWAASRLDAYAPDGQLLRSIDLPARQVTCPAFIGARADRIAVTSAWQAYDAKARAEDPNAGKTFLLDLPVKG